MGIAGFFSIGKKEKKPFRMPQEIASLRARINSENKENFPNLSRFRELQREAGHACSILDEIISTGQNADDAFRVREDIKEKIALLGEKISKNLQDAKKDSKDDYLENTLDYLQRKSIRNEAKTRFTEFLLLIQETADFCSTGRFEQGRTINTAAVALNKVIADLNHNFIKVHTGDREIQALRQEMQKKVAELKTVFEQNRAILRENGLDVRTASNIITIQEALKE